MNPGDNGTFWMPPPSSTMAGDVDSLFYYIFYVGLFFFTLIVGLMLFFAFKYRRKGKAGLTSGVSHNTLLEVAWTAIPTLIMLSFFYLGFRDFIKMNVVPANSLEVKVTGQRWFWSFDYPNGVNVQNDMYVPVGTPIKLLMSSRDMLHSFFVPDFRLKMDVLPNRYQVAWFEATEIGVYNLFCAEYCGTQHSGMLGKINVVSEEDYNIWLDDNMTFGEGLTPEEYGAELFIQKQCHTCHSVDGTANQGPTFQGLFGKTEQMVDGTSVVVDENYIRESILDPQTKVVKGFQPVMVTYQGLLKDPQIDALVAYIKSLK